MNQDQSSNNKRIAHNTILLYIRMILSMGLSLYTSRIILKALGISDYGVYNVVNSLVTIFNFLMYTLSNSTQRYIQYAIVTQNKNKLKEVFLTSMNLYILLSIIIVILGETIGLWFFKTQIEVPIDRQTAAMWVYQISIITTVYAIIATPYNAIIISYEKMNIFAYISIVEVIFKLITAYILLFYIKTDKLIAYAVLSCIVQIIIRSLYNNYCTKTFKETQFSFLWNKQLSKEMLSYSSWVLIGSLSGSLSNQGVKILLNIFFGPIINAAIAIADQVKIAVTSLRTNFQTALNPQITKSFAANNLEYMSILIIKSMKYSFFMLWILALPICFQADTILQIWLGNTPPHTSFFVILLLMSAFQEALANPLNTATEAIGNIKKIKIITSVVTLLTLPISYILLYINDALFNYYTPLYIYTFLTILEIFVYIFYLQKKIHFRIKDIKKMFYQLISVSSISLILCYSLKFIISEETSLTALIYHTLIYIAISIIIIYAVGTDYSEKKLINKYIAKLCKK